MDKCAEIEQFKHKVAVQKNYIRFLEREISRVRISLMERMVKDRELLGRNADELLAEFKRLTLKQEN